MIKWWHLSIDKGATLKKNIVNILIYLGIHLGLLAAIIAVISFLSLVALDQLSTMQNLPWLVGLSVGGGLSALISRIIWKQRYQAGQTVPCIFCAGKFTSVAALYSPALSDKYREVQCPHCKKMNPY